MLLIEIFGSGCANCNKLEDSARKAAVKLGIEANVQKVTDFGTMAAMGIMSTPAIAINGQVKSSGRVLTPDQVARLIQEL